MLEKQNETLNEIKYLRKDLSSILDIRLKKIEKDIVRIKKLNLD
jgi:hypothetical protein